MGIALLRGLWLAHLMALTSATGPKSFRAVRCGYMPFAVETEAPKSRENLQKEDVPKWRRADDGTLGQGLVRLAWEDSTPGVFDDRIARFAIVFANGHTLAIDRDGTALIDGAARTLSRRSFALIAEWLAIVFEPPFATD